MSDAGFVFGGTRTTPSVIAERDAAQAYHNSTFKHLEDLPMPFNPSGLVPYPCAHGIAVKPARFPRTKMFGARLDDEGNEYPPYQGQSWGRAKYLLDMEPLAFEGKITLYRPKCFICVGRAVGDDFYTAADGSPLR